MKSGWRFADKSIRFFAPTAHQERKWKPSEDGTPEESARAQPNHLSPFELEVWVHKAPAVDFIGS
jgi:hypothetical protein